MAITECGHGHLYDAEQYASCPYCNGGGNVINFDEANGDRTMPIGNFSGTEDSGKTVAPEGYMKRSSDGDKTVGILGRQGKTEPVAGWLVCIDGPEKGKDYRLLARINTIGRSEKMDVHIREDATISRENHARIAYDPRHNNFQLIPAESINNIYLNDEPVYTPVRLSAYDVIEFGESKMVFVPFCCERFQWPDKAD